MLVRFDVWELWRLNGTRCRYLAIVGVSGKRAMKQISIVDFNISVFQEAVIKLISERWEEPTKPPE